MQIRPAVPADSAQVADIYNYYIDTSHATFELEPVDAVEMEMRLRETFDRGYPFYVAGEGGQITGYAYGRYFRPRAAYRHSVEISVYIRNGYEGCGIGRKLYDELLPVVLKGDFHAVIAGISLPNDASIRLHESYGFEKVAHFREVGFKLGRWIDVGYWELLIAGK